MHGMTDAPGPSSRRHRLMLAALLAACLALGLATITGAKPRVDGIRLFTLAFNLGTEGVYSDQLPDEVEPGADLVSDNHLEPLYSAVEAPFAALAARHTNEDIACFLEGAPACEGALRFMKLPNVLFYVLMVAATAWTTRRATGSEWLAMITGSVVGLLYLFQTYINEFYTEILSALLFTATVGALVASLQEEARRRRWLAIAGLAMGALALTKSAYFLMIPGVGAAVGVAYWWLAADHRWRSALRPVGMFLLLAFLLPGLWIVRNQVAVEDASLLQLRSSGSVNVLALRAEFGAMTPEEYWAAWVYWSTPSAGPEIAADILDPEDYYRITRGSENGFYQRSRRGDGRVQRYDEEAVVALYLDELPRQAGLTPLIAWRGTVPWAQFGIPDGPSWQPRLQLVQEYFYRLMLPALLLAAVSAVRRRDPVLLLVVTPMAASVAFHAVLTHYLPRYSVTIAPVGAMLIMSMLATAFVWARGRVPAAAPSPDPT